MTEGERIFLAYIADQPNGRAFTDDLIRQFGSVEALDRINALTKRGLLAPDVYAGTPDRPMRHLAQTLTTAGRDALAAANEEKRQRAEDEAEKRRHDVAEDRRHRQERRDSWIQWTVTTAIAIVSFIGGMFVESRTAFVERIFLLFH